MLLRAGCRGGRSEPTRTQRCVYHVKGMNDCLRRIAGLNSPASPPLKKTDTSYNNHALQKTARKRTRCRLDPQNTTKQPNRRVKVKMYPAHNALPAERRCAILAKFHF